MRLCPHHHASRTSIRSSLGYLRGVSVVLLEEENSAESLIEDDSEWDYDERPLTQPSLKRSLEEAREIYRTATWEPQSIRISPMYRNHSSECVAHGILQGMCHGRIRAPSVRATFLFGDPCVVVPAFSAKCANAPYHESCFYATSSTSTMKVDDGGSLLSRVNFIDHPFCLATMSLWECHTFDSG